MLLGFVDRGSHNVLTVHPDKPLANNYSLNTVDICPVGALTSNDFRFQMRVWFLRETKSICTGCARGCNTVIGSREDKVYRQTPRENNDVNSAWMCDAGRLGFHHLESEARLTEPMLKVGGEHVGTDWPEAIRKAAEGLLKYKGESLAIIASGRMTNEELYLVRTLADTLEAGTVDIVKRTGDDDDYLVHADKNPNSRGAKAILKLRTPGSKIRAIKKGVADGSIKALLVLGEDLIKAGFEDVDLKKLKVLVSSHILANPTAKRSHIVLPGAGFAEKRGSMINATGRLQRLNKATEPPVGARDDWETLQDLNRALDGLDAQYELADVFVEMASMVPAFKGLSFSKIGDLGVEVIETEETVPLLARERERIQQGLIVG